ncbi:hypothetical protein HC928_24885 [bacterium]|nr:hypothetical protein [bacterium]
MGLPIHHFVASTNANNIVPQYLASGKFEPRASLATISNAMDVGNPSNFPRMTEVFENEFDAVRSHISGASYTDEQTRAAMAEVHKKTGYLLDPHGAVAYLGLRDYLRHQNQNAVGVFLATAHPSKFIDVVEETLQTKLEVPQRLAELANKPTLATPLGTDFAGFKQFLMA